MNKIEMAAGFFAGGFNCAQSVLAVFCEKYDMDRQQALKLACGLGGGVRFGEICGAVSGGVLVVGLKYGQFAAEDKESKSECYAKTTEFVNAFREINGSVVCRQILGYDISKKEEYDIAAGKNLFKTLCAGMVKSAVSLLEELGY